MSKVKMALALSALAAMLCAPWGARAQTVTNSGQSTGGVNQPQMVGGTIDGTNTSQQNIYSGAGGLKTTALNAIALVGGAACISDTTAWQMADSSTALDVSTLRLTSLDIRVVGGGVIRLAVQIRHNIGGSSDTSSVFPIAMRNSAFGLGTTASDTLAVGLDVAPTALAVGSREFLVKVQPDYVEAAQWGNSCNISIPLATLYGADLEYDYVSVRIRLIGSNAAPSPTITAYLYGKPR